MITPKISNESSETLRTQGNNAIVLNREEMIPITDLNDFRHKEHVASGGYRLPDLTMEAQLLKQIEFKPVSDWEELYASDTVHTLLILDAALTKGFRDDLGETYGIPDLFRGCLYNKPVGVKALNQVLEKISAFKDVLETAVESPAGPNTATLILTDHVLCNIVKFSDDLMPGTLAGTTEEIVGKIKEKNYGTHGTMYQQNLYDKIVELATQQNPPVAITEGSAVQDIVFSLAKERNKPCTYEYLRNRNVTDTLAQVGNYVGVEITLNTMEQLYRELAKDIAVDTMFFRTSPLKKIGNVYRGTDRMDEYAPEMIPEKMRMLIDAINNLQHVDEESAYAEAAKIMVEFQRIHPTNNFSGRLGHIVTCIALGKMGYPPFIVPQENNADYVHEVTEAMNSNYTRGLARYIKSHSIAQTA